MRCSSFKSPMSASNRCSRTLALALREKRLRSLFDLPRCDGSRQCAPERKTHRAPFTNRRLTTTIWPQSLALPDSKRGASLCAVVNYLFAIRCVPIHEIENTINQLSGYLRIVIMNYIQSKFQAEENYKVPKLARF